MMRPVVYVKIFIPMPLGKGGEVERSLAIDYDALRGSAIPNGECYACYLLLSAIESLKLEPHVQISSLKVNSEPRKGETLSVTVFLDGTLRRETLEFYRVQGE
jgi:hypothetical protein